MSFWEFATGSPCVAGLMVFCVYLAVDAIAGHMVEGAKALKGTSDALEPLPDDDGEEEEPEDDEDEDEPDDEDEQEERRR